MELPGSPRLLIELGAVLNDPDTDTRDVTDLLKQDPPLAARLIRIANSAAYGRAEPVASTEDAVSYVGFAEIHRLVGAVAVTQLTEKPLEHYRVSALRLRRVSLFTAVLMEELARYTDESPNCCYTVGLLRSLGIMTLQILARKADPAIPLFEQRGGHPLDAWEQEHWGLDNCEAAEIILTDWRLPTEAVSAIRHHYRPEGGHHPLTHLLSLACGAAHRRYEGLPGEGAYWKATEENFRTAGLDATVFQTVCEKAQVTFARLESALG